MKLEKAIEILEKQRGKLLDPKHYKDEVWVIQTASFIKDFFGEQSIEYECVQRFSFTLKIYAGTPPEELKQLGYENDQKILRFTEACIETLKEKGIYKPESKWKKWLKEPENIWKIFVFIVGLLISIATIVISIAKAMNWLS